jgi:hypothetical protein
MNTQRMIFKCLAVVLLSAMFFQSVLILPSASAQAANTSTPTPTSTQQEPTPTGCNAEPCPVTPSSSTSTHSLQSFTATGSVTGVTDPALIPNPSVYDFYRDKTIPEQVFKPVVFARRF